MLLGSVIVLILSLQDPLRVRERAAFHLVVELKLLLHLLAVELLSVEGASLFVVAVTYK
jgi:hypothetical protein